MKSKGELRLTPEEIRQKVDSYLGEVIVYHEDLVEALVIDIADAQLNKVLGHKNVAIVDIDKGIIIIGNKTYQIVGYTQEITKEGNSLSEAIKEGTIRNLKRLGKR